jgi:hypothetical protein
VQQWKTNMERCLVREGRACSNGRFRHRPMLWTAVGFLALLLAVPAYALPRLEATIGGGGSLGFVELGQTVTVEVRASGIPAGSDGNGLFGFGFAFLYSSTGLSAANPQLGPLWISTGFDDSRNDPGDVGLTGNRFFQQNGPFGDNILLGSIVFTGLALGTYLLDMTHFTGVGDNLLFDGTILDAGSSFFSNATIQVVPEPGTLGLMVVGMLLLRATRVRPARS